MKHFKLPIFFFCLIIVLSCSKETQHENEIIQIANTLSVSDTHSVVSGIFDIPELQIMPSPTNPNQITFPPGENVIDYDVSPAGKIIAVITKLDGNSMIRFCELDQKEITESYSLPEGFSGEFITWHPQSNILFISGSIKSQYQILRIEKNNGLWNNKLIFSTPLQIKRLISCPRPFITRYDFKTNKNYYNYRLFFGIDNGDNTFRTVSVTEHGGKYYQVIGPSETITSAELLEADSSPSTMEASWALPVAFHPAGHQFIWEDKKGNFYTAVYGTNTWEQSRPLGFEIEKGGTITPTPNGLEIIQWKSKNKGVGLFSIPKGKTENILMDFSFVSSPKVVPDGKGIIGLINNDNVSTLNYLPINTELSDVLNAWMYIETENELDLFSSNYGLFRPTSHDQLYDLYETENYYCGSYDRSSPTRPYLVTTDIFWELIGAAYQGLFILKEREEAIPNFREFIVRANDYFENRESKWSKVFYVLNEFYTNDESESEEVQNIVSAVNEVSQITGENYTFSNLKPRGHYTSTPDMEKYFKAFRYFTTILSNDKSAVNELVELPHEISVFAENWVNSYAGFIAPSRSQLVWKNVNKSVPSYSNFLLNNKSLFPLSWGFDNEVLFASVYHANLPEEQQVKGAGGFRLMPSGLDIASVFGSGLAEKLSAGDFEKYPPLKKVIDNLKDNLNDHSNKPDFRNNIYNNWLNAIAVQLIDTVNSTNGLKDKVLWQTKRLQTGLATWATLRHATVLVNERGAAECGEGGFEEILMRAPRGYVEPDPYTFSSIASLFDKMGIQISNSIEADSKRNKKVISEKKSLYDGILLRLREAADEARMFQLMAEKERNGIELTNKENERILNVARVAEHLFLVFNSISNENHGLAHPDPMPKISDVFGDGFYTPFLLSAVGSSIEWNHIVPFYGRRQIVKGSVYSYYEFESDKLLNDSEWRERVKNEEYMPWVKPYFANRTATEMAKTGY